MAAVAEKLGVTSTAVAPAWLRSKPGVTSPIVGPRRLDHLFGNLAALDVELTAEQVTALDEVSALRLNYPYDLNRQTGPMLQFGGTTVDGRPSIVYPPLLESPTRY